MADLIKARFIHKILNEEAAKFLTSQTSRIEAVLTEHTGYLRTHRTARAYGSDGDFEGEIQFTHPAYERFLDMARLSGQEKGHRRRIHNRPIMKTYNRIAERLMTEFTDQTQQTLREEIEAIRAKFSQ